MNGMNFHLIATTLYPVTEPTFSSTRSYERMKSPENATPTLTLLRACWRIATNELASQIYAAQAKVSRETIKDLPDNDRSYILHIAPVYAEDLCCVPRREVVTFVAQATCPVDTQPCQYTIVRLASSCPRSRTFGISGATRWRCIAHRHTVVC